MLDTAMRCGYASECHFITAFRQTAGGDAGAIRPLYSPLLEGAEKSVPSARHLPEGLISPPPQREEGASPC